MDGRLCLVDLAPAADGARLGRCAPEAHREVITGLAALTPPAGKATLASASWDGSVALWRDDLTLVARFDLGAPVNAVAAAPARGLLAAAVSRDRPRRSRARTAAESRGDHRREAGRLDHAVELWDLHRQRRLGRTHPHSSPPTVLALDRRGRVLVSGGWDFRVVVTGLDHAGRPGRTRARIEGLSQIVTGLALDADLLATASWIEHGSSAPSCALFRLGGGTGSQRQ